LDSCGALSLLMAHTKFLVVTVRVEERMSPTPKGPVQG
jgi:hypothetical protein